MGRLGIIIFAVAVALIAYFSNESTKHRAERRQWEKEVVEIVDTFHGLSAQLCHFPRDEYSDSGVIAFVEYNPYKNVKLPDERAKCQKVYEYFDKSMKKTAQKKTEFLRTALPYNRFNCSWYDAGMTWEEYCSRRNTEAFP